MPNTINLTPESIETITSRITARSESIEYSIHIPRDQREAVSKGASLMWAKVVEYEYRYIDSAQDKGVAEEVFDEADIDIDSLIDANESYSVEQFFLPSGEGKPLSLEDFQVGLSRAVTDDLVSAWQALIREVIEEVHGEDPLGGNEGLVFPGVD